MKRIIIVTFIILFILALIYINKKSKIDEVKENTNTTQTEQQTSSQNMPLSASSSVDVSISPTAILPQTVPITVNGGNFYFKPNIIKVKQGDTVVITFINDEGFHDFKIDEFDVATKQIKEKAQDVVTFVANKKGSFEYYCSVGTHRQTGMKGTLVVE